MKTLQTLGVFLTSLLLGSSQMLAQTITNPVQDYLDSANEDRDLYVPNVQDILRLEIDIDGDGKKETLLSTTGYGDRQGNMWTAYLPIGGGYKRQEAEIKFRSDYYVTAELDTGRCLLTYTPGKGGGMFQSYKIQNGNISGVEVAQIANLDDQEGTGNKLFKKYFANIKADEHGVLTLLSVSDLTQQGFRVPPRKTDPASN